MFDSGLKIKCFDELKKLCFNRNFGSLSKSDFEVVMFHFYIKSLCLENRNRISDYMVAKELNITPQRVRTLKERDAIRFPKYENDSWKTDFTKLVKNAVFEDGKVILTISDFTIMNEVCDVVEENGGYIDIQLNKKILKVRVENFLQLVFDCCDKETVDDVKKAIEDNISENSQLCKELSGYKPRERYIALMKKVGTSTASFVALLEALSKIIPVFDSLLKK